MDFSSYQSPFSWRYASTEMRELWSEEYKIKLWRRVWVALAQAQHEAGLLTKAEIIDIKKHATTIDIDRIFAIEKETRHDLMAAVKEFAEKAKVGGGKLHLGATSVDILDNAEIIRILEGLTIIEHKLRALLLLFADKIKTYAKTPCLGFTHLQPAVPTTIGYRFAFYAQELLENYRQLQWVKNNLKTKGFKGAVGSYASYEQLLHGKKMNALEMEKNALQQLGLTAFTVSNQVYSRQQDYIVISLLAQIAASLYKCAADARILQSPMFGEWQEEFGAKQVGSSAMPHKKNPVNAENICSLARYITHLPPVMLENAMHSYLERTLDDSANRRLVMPDAFLATDHILRSSARLIKNLDIKLPKIRYNLEQYYPFAACELVLLTAASRGADRQLIHERIRNSAIDTWKQVEQGQKNQLFNLLKKDSLLQRYLTEKDFASWSVSGISLKAATSAANRLSKLIYKEVETSTS